MLMRVHCKSSSLYHDMLAYVQTTGFDTGHKQNLSVC